MSQINAFYEKYYYLSKGESAIYFHAVLQVSFQHSPTLTWLLLELC